MTCQIFEDEMKRCFRCLVEKPVDEFYRHPRMADGHLNKCKECTKEDVRVNAGKTAGQISDRQKRYRETRRERLAAYEQSRANLPHRMAAREAYAATPEGRAAANRAKRAYVDRNPAKRAAHIAVGNALRDGKLKRQPCEVCGAIAQAHHDDYSKPLDVRWLCTKHHAEWHKHNEPLCPEQGRAA